MKENFSKTSLFNQGVQWVENTNPSSYEDIYNNPRSDGEDQFKPGLISCPVEGYSELDWRSFLSSVESTVGELREAHHFIFDNKEYIKPNNPSGESRNKTEKLIKKREKYFVEKADSLVDKLNNFKSETSFDIGEFFLQQVPDSMLSRVLKAYKNIVKIT